MRIELAARGASAGVAYLGIVETGMTRALLDADDLGRETASLLPWPLGVRITAADAARAIADGIARRAPMTIAPRAWWPYALLRGCVNVALDGRLAADRSVRDLIRRVEAR